MSDPTRMRVSALPTPVRGNTSQPRPAPARRQQVQIRRVHSTPRRRHIRAIAEIVTKTWFVRSCILVTAAIGIGGTFTSNAGSAVALALFAMAVIDTIITGLLMLARRVLRRLQRGATRNRKRDQAAT